MEAPASQGRREFLISKGWIQAVVLVVLFGFFVLGLLAYRTYMAHPPVPKKVVGPAENVLFTGTDISHGQRAFLNHGLMEYGSALGRPLDARWLHSSAALLVRPPAVLEW
jgi:nitric oxide reductase subunit B